MKRSVKFAALITSALLIFCACGAGTSDGGRTEPDKNYYSGVDNKAGMPAVISEDRDVSLGTLAPGESQVTDRDNTKVIKRAALTLQTTKFDETVRTIEAFVLEKGGYLESESVNNGGIRSSGSNYGRYRTASFTVRVPAENYSSFLSGMNDKCHVVSLTQNSQDVGEQYFDTEQRLETLRNKHERLEALLKEAKEMKDIISLENALSDTEYEINRYTATLNKYDSLIGFSTISITLEEVADPDSSVTDDPGFFERIGKSFRRGLDNFADSMESFMMWLSYNVIGIIVFVVILVVLIKTKPFAKVRKRLGGKKNKAEDASASEKGGN